MTVSTMTDFGVQNQLQAVINKFEQYLNSISSGERAQVEKARSTSLLNKSSDNHESSEWTYKI